VSEQGRTRMKHIPKAEEANVQRWVAADPVFAPGTGES
jgi:hypothetical protein